LSPQDHPLGEPILVSGWLQDVALRCARALGELASSPDLTPARSDVWKETSVPSREQLALYAFMCRMRSANPLEN